jgi:hypothetical protein
MSGQTPTGCGLAILPTLPSLDSCMAQCTTTIAPQIKYLKITVLSTRTGLPDPGQDGLECHPKKDSAATHLLSPCHASACQPQHTSIRPCVTPSGACPRRDDVSNCSLSPTGKHGCLPNPPGRQSNPLLHHSHPASVAVKMLPHNLLSAGTGLRLLTHLPRLL